jgi:hypothetical protein
LVRARGGGVAPDRLLRTGGAGGGGFAGADGGFGIFFALTGPEYSEADWYATAKLLRRKLLLVPDVKKVELFGVQQETIFVEMQRDQMARLGRSCFSGISPWCGGTRLIR